MSNKNYLLKITNLDNLYKYFDKLEAYSLACTIIDDDDSNDPGYLELIIDDFKKFEIIKDLLNQDKVKYNITISDIVDIDWVLEYQKNFKSIIIENFNIHASWQEKSDKLINIKMDPGQAFGTGEHSTTKLCAMALNYLSKIITPNNILDMGTGTGVLAIMAQKLWLNCNIIAADNDENSVLISKENFDNNHIKNYNVYLADNLKDNNILKNKPYDIFIANILANPLISMSDDIDILLSEEAYIILSGFYENQLELITQAYKNYKIEKKYNLNNWCCLILKK